MSKYTRFAVVGAGLLGGPIVKNIAAEPGTTVIVLTRPSSTAKDLPSGVVAHKVDYTDVSAVSKVLKENDIEVLISLLNGSPEIWGLQHQLIDAAKAAGTVKLFVPSEFGFPTYGAKEGFPVAKAVHAEYSQSQGLPVALFYNGLFTEFAPWLGGIDGQGNKDTFKVAFSGEKALSTTSISDIAGYVAYVLTHLPASTLADKAFRIEGERLTLVEFAERLAKKNGWKVEKTEVGGFQQILQDVTEQGKAVSTFDYSTGRDSESLDNDLWEGHVWKKVKDVHGA